MKPLIEIYGTPSCLWCNKAKDFITTYGLMYKDYHVGKDITPIEFREIFPGFTRVPQIKINGQHIGGYEEMVKYIEETLNGFGEQSL